MNDFGNTKRWLKTLGMSNKIKWILRDDFLDTLAAGSVNGTLATPGPGTRTVVDTNGKLSVGSNALNFATGGSVAGNPGIWYPPTVRTPGTLLFLKSILPTTSSVYFGFDSNTSGTTAADFMSFSTTTINEIRANGSFVIGVSLTPGNIYYFLIAIRASGSFYFIKGLPEYSLWTLIFPSFSMATTPIYPSTMAGGAITVFNPNSIRIPKQFWLPVPLASDSFNRANNASSGITDGAGHAEANGGAGLTWTGGTISGSALVIIPTAEAEMHTSANAASDPNGNEADATTGWTSSGGTFTSSSVTPAIGSYKLNLLATGTAGKMIFTPSATVGKWYQTSFRVMQDVEYGNVFSISAGQVYPIPSLNVVNNSWLAGSATFRSSSATPAIGFGARATAGDIVGIDNFSMKPLTTSTLFSSLQVSTVNTMVDCQVSAFTTRTQCGLVARLDSATTPANFIIVYFDGIGNVIVEECVGGVYAASQLLNIVQAFAVSNHLILSLNENSWKLYYVTSAGVVTKLGSGTTHVTTGNLFGGFSTYSANKINSFVVWAKGNEKQYDYTLNKFIQ